MSLRTKLTDLVKGVPIMTHENVNPVIKETYALLTSTPLQHLIEKFERAYKHKGTYHPVPVLTDTRRTKAIDGVDFMVDEILADTIAFVNDGTPEHGDTYRTAMVTSLHTSAPTADS